VRENNPIRVYRGIQRHAPSGRDGSKVGMHWTRDIHTAMEFAKRGGLEAIGEAGPATNGYILEGLVDPQHILSPSSRADERILGRNKVLDQDTEREISVRPGSPVTVVGHHRLLSIAQMGKGMGGTQIEHRPIVPYQGIA